MKIDSISYTDLTNKIVNYGKTKLAEGDVPLVTTLIQQFYSDINWSDFQDRSIDELFGAVLSIWKLIQKRQPNEHKITISNPQQKSDGWECKNTVINIVLDDMPFLVDSLQMELNRMGISVHAISHMGGIKVARNDNGNITAIYPISSTAPTNTIIEAPIYIEIARQHDSKKIAEIAKNLDRILLDVKTTVDDWQPMQEKVKAVISDINSNKNLFSSNEVSESIEFLRWLLDNNFTFLGYRNYEVIKVGNKSALHIIPNSSLGILRDESKGKTNKYFEEYPPKALAQILSKKPLILAKTNTISTVHRSYYTESIEIKKFNKDGNIVGMQRFIGLYSSTSYYTSVKNVPVLRAKAEAILQKFGYPRNGYASKTLQLILESLPRNDFLEGNVDELYEIAIGIYKLQGRRLTKLFVREDDYRRYISCLVFVPRDNFNTNLREEIQNILMQEFQGTEATFSITFTNQLLARIHFVIRVNPAKTLKYDITTIEQKIIAASYSWNDALHDQVLQCYGENVKSHSCCAKYAQAFPIDYCANFSAKLALQDIQTIEKLSTEQPFAVTFYQTENAANQQTYLKIFHLDQQIPLSETLPILENLGFKIVSEYTYKITPNNAATVWLHDFVMSANHPINLAATSENFYAALQQTWLGKVENDGFNNLIIPANLNWREVTILRAIAKYMKQMKFPFSQQYLETTLINNAKIAELLIGFFHDRFDPNLNKAKKTAKESSWEKDILNLLESVKSLDEDRILRQYLAIMQAMVRTNFYQDKPYISFKISSQQVPELPLPRPLFEIFVYSTEFEGIHLRMAKVARGGLRWSDRREDFRTEILGLMKAQQVKNVVIVPNGAKGGFVLKQVPAKISRDELQNLGIACYKKFISALLDITDNIVSNKLIPPKQVVRHDADDPYLVVAADKGTATFSNIANGISKEYKFWLYDAFASGGATGYDHKAIGITARGAWESVKYCFAEIGIDTQKQDFTVVGIGDLSGDVFGNGMILSRHIKLLAAFNHQHIFLDPNPNPEATYKERVRMFNLGQSTWDDYNTKLISTGGGIFLRSLKAIPLSKEVRKVFGIEQSSLPPNELIKILLKAKVDLLWNGGIGTYVKASTETHADVGDRTNDALRVDATELRCKVISEGGNLGLTQLGRVEYSLHGGIINTDFIDNSGGVDCSDHEVNIKILLNSVMATGKLKESQRDILLAKMTTEVADLVLYNNYRQARAISYLTDYSKTNIDMFVRCLKFWESAGKINRALEFLPTDKAFEERKAAGLGLTRPEIAIMLAYSKLIMKSEILQSDIPDDPYYFQYLNKLFPKLIVKDFAKPMIAHRLRREIITTQLTNDLITNMGITFVQQIKDETNASTIDVVRAYAAASKIFNLDAIIAAIENLDGKVTPQTQQKLVNEVRMLIWQTVRWFVKNKTAPLDATKLVTQFADKVVKLKQNLPKLITANKKGCLDALVKEFTKANVPTAIANDVAYAQVAVYALDIIEMAAAFKSELIGVAKTYFALIAKQ